MMRSLTAPRAGATPSSLHSSRVDRNSSRVDPRRRRLLRAGVVAIALSFAGLQPDAAGAADDFGDRAGAPEHWVGTWGASPQQPVTAFGSAPSFLNQTIREIVRISVGGGRLRVRLSNEFGAQPLQIGAAHVGISAGGSSVQPGSDRVLTFSGQPSILVPVSAPVLSDPVDLEVADLTSLAISIYLPGSTGPATWHPEGKQTAYITAGDATGAATLGSGVSTSTARFFLTGVQVRTVENKSAVVTFGDSITDGTASTVDANHRWPDRLAERLAGRGDTDAGVVDEGISGNRILHDNAGPNALSRFDRDVLATPGLRFMTVLLGINDIGFGGFIPTEAVTADDIIAGHRQMIAHAHSRGIRIYGATLTPFDNVGSPYFSPAHEVQRQAVNAWIRTSHEFDAVIDFDAVVRDPAHPSKLAPAFDSGDHLHPSDAGYKAMADSIDLRLFRRAEEFVADR
jgi:lysophospholipase L1-like esterase